MTKPPASYTQGFSAAVLASHTSRTAETSCAYLLPHLKSADKILDIGCGPGSITISLAPYIPQGSIIGIDSSQEVVDIANKQANRPANCRFSAGDVYALPFADNSFDVVHVHQVLLHLPNATKALSEMRRVCRIGGIVACREGDWDSIIVFPSSPILVQWKKIAERVFRNAGSEPNAGRMLVHWALGAGFHQDKISYSMGSQTYTSQKDTSWWGDSLAQRYGEGDWRTKVVAQKLASNEEVDDISAAWRDWTHTPGAIYSIACGQVLCTKTD